MAVPPIPTTSVPSITPASVTANKPTSATSDTGSFSDVFSKLLGGVNQQQLASEEAVQQLVAGENDNLQDVVLSVAKADLSFRMVLEIRNRLIEAYQEVMRMQV